VAVNGVVYVTTQNGNLYALSASNGSLVWRYHADAAAGPLTVANGAIYFGAADGASLQSPSYLYAVNAGTGMLLWRASVGKAAAKPVVGQWGRLCGHRRV
jgi:outer membrane protein assembly factor BamB